MPSGLTKRLFETADRPEAEKEASAEATIRALAADYGIDASEDGIDIWSEAVSSLAGDDVSLDEVGMSIARLREAKAVDGIELTKLHGRYLEERSA